MGAGSSLAAPLAIQLHANGTGKAEEDGLGAWAPTVHGEAYLEPGFGLAQPQEL